MISLNDITNFSDNKMSDYVKEFRMNNDAKESQISSNGNYPLKKMFFRLPSAKKDEIFYKSRVIKRPGYNFISISIDFIADEYKRKLKVDLNITTMADLFEKLRKVGCHKVFDIYFNGVKQNPLNVNILWDYNKIIFILPEYPFKINIVVRNSIMEFYNNKGNSILIPSIYKQLLNDSFKLAFKNGIKTDVFNLEPKDNGDVNVIFDKDATDCELVLLPKYTKQIIVQDSNWIDIYPGAKSTINTNNIFVFDKGVFYTINESDIKLKGNSIVKFTPNTVGKDVVILHDDSYDPNISSFNIIEWYKKNVNENVARELNDANPLDLIASFENFNKDISCSMSYGSNKNSYEFNRDIIKDLILYNSENFKKYTDLYLKKRDNISDVLYINIKDNYKESIRYNNYDVPFIKPERFPFPMVHFKISNPEYKPIQVYIDGIALFRHVEIYNVCGETHIYIRLNKFLKNSTVEIERYNIDTKTIIKDMMVDNNGLINTNLDYKYTKNLLNLYKVENDIYNKIDSFEYDNKTGNLSIGQNKRGLYRLVVNNAIVRQEYVVNSRKLKQVEFNMPNHKFSIYDNDYYRVYKNGRLIPRKFYRIEFPNNENKRKVPFIHVDCQCYMSEVITVEFVPYRMKEVFSQDLIDEFGKIKIDRNSLEFPIGLDIDSIYLNGRKLNNDNIIQNSACSMELCNIISRKNFYILLREDYNTYTNFPEFTDAFHKGNGKFDDYIKSVMVGSRINDLENNELEKDYNVMRDLYWDLYNEYLKYAIVNFGGKLPKYIAIKYSDLIDEDNMILIDCSEEMNHWMPLDATKNIEQKMDQILDIYEKMVDRIHNSTNIVPYELSEYEIQKLKEAGLITDNVIAIDLSK